MLLPNLLLSRRAYATVMLGSEPIWNCRQEAAGWVAGLLVAEPPRPSASMRAAGWAQRPQPLMEA